MITREQMNEVNQFLSGKNLPLDLKVEIFDHILEQVDYKIEFEIKDFATAFLEIEKSWQRDLKMSRRFMWLPKTKIHHDTIWKSSIEIFKKSFSYFILYFIVSVTLMLYNKTLASNFLFAIYCLAIIVFFVYLIFNFKIIRTIAGNRDKKNISYMQGGTQAFYLSSIFIISMILINFDNRFDKYYNFIIGLKNNFDFTQVGIGAFIIFNIYAFGWVYGFCYYLQYKKSIEYLQQKMNLKL
ncbi:hypothetical protein [Kaistella polysaccharea]|uniref:hypothetical protein n=1 Tax=Kaistella polysaccharea TaxID=2878534 RepID=UPI001CF4F2D2|nr:hypothetical protein [Kaistella polysaccharea]